MIDNKRVVGITLARGGSKSIVHKNIIPILGKPLIQYTSDEALKSSYIDDYYVSTDCPEIHNICQSLKLNVIMRPPSLAEDTSKSSDALIHAVQDLDYDYVIEIMCTNPLKTVIDIVGCIKKLHDCQCESVVSVVRLLDHHPARIKYIDNDILCDFFPETPESRRQDLLPWAYIRNGSIYAMTHDFLIREKCRYNKNTRPYIMPSERTINIDEPVDLTIAEAMLQRKFS